MSFNALSFYSSVVHLPLWEVFSKSHGLALQIWLFCRCSLQTPHDVMRVTFSFPFLHLNFCLPLKYLVYASFLTSLISVHIILMPVYHLCTCSCHLWSHPCFSFYLSETFVHCTSRGIFIYIQWLLLFSSLMLTFHVSTLQTFWLPLSWLCLKHAVLLCLALSSTFEQALVK